MSGIEDSSPGEMVFRMHGKAVGYVRVSKKDEGSDEYLAGRQIDVIAEWAAENEVDVFDWFFDLGVDGTEPLDRRSAGARLLARVKRGDITHVVAANLDVLGKGRTLRDLAQSLLEARKGLRVVTVLPGPHDTAKSPEVIELDRARARKRSAFEAA